MFCYIYMILSAVALFKSGNPYPVIQTPTNIQQSPQVCTQCSTAPLSPPTCCVPTVQNQQAMTVDLTISTTSCCPPQNQQCCTTQNQQSCTQPSLPCQTTLVPTTSTTSCCPPQNQQCCTTQNQQSCTQPSIPCQMTLVPTTSTTSCCPPQNQQCCTTQNQQSCTQPSIPCQTTLVPTTSTTSCYPPQNQQCYSPQNQQCCSRLPVVPTTPIVTTTPAATITQIVTTTPVVTKPQIKCPENTIKINNTCHPVFCGTGIFRNGACIVTLCPKGTVWTGTQCELPKPHDHAPIEIINTIKTNLSFQTSHTMNFSNVVDIVIPDSSPRRRFPCCTVVTPHTCQWDDSQYDCGSRSYKTCSSVCSSPFIQLRPPSFMPIPSLCESNDCYSDHRPFYPDCSNCYGSDYECRTYCRERTICQVKHCQSMDARIYCRKYPSSIGCREMDGCVDDWCI